MQKNEIRKFYIKGMTCIHCQNKIEDALKKTKGVRYAKVDYNTGFSTVEFDPVQISFVGIEKRIRNLGYSSFKDLVDEKPSRWIVIVRILATIASLFILYRIVGVVFGFDLVRAFPQAEAGMGYGLLFVVGLLTSVHCLAMCGGINISQCVAKKPEESIDKKNPVALSTFRSSFLYNAGRVISYTVIGGIVGALGGVISFPGMAKGIVAILAGVFMVVMGLDMLSLFPSLRRFVPRLPRVFARKINSQKASNQPFYVGLLNGLMPCGPLQAMQLYALSTGSPVKGALSMLVFSLGTVPLLFGLGAFSTLMSKNFAGKVRSVSAALVVVLGVFMLGNGLSLSGIRIPIMFSTSTNQKFQATVTEQKNSENLSTPATSGNASDNVQIVKTTLAGGDYTEISVKKGIPVQWTIQAERKDITGCNNVLVIPEYNIRKKLVPGDNVILFTPEKSGTIPYSCWMGMITSTITVRDS